MSAIDRLAPQNREAEEAVLGSLLIDPDAILDVDFLTSKMFYWQINQWAYEAITNLNKRNEPVDSLTVINELNKTRKIEDVESYVIGLVSAVPTSINARAYAKIVEAAYIRREMIHTASKIANMAYNEELDINDVIADYALATQKPFENLADNSDGFTLDDAMEAHIGRMEAIYNNEMRDGLYTGYRDIDKILSIPRGQTLVIGGRTSMGKTAFAHGIIMRNAKANGLVFSLEMKKTQLGARTIAAAINAPLADIRRPTNEQHIEAAYKALSKFSGSKWKLYTKTYSLEAIITTARKEAMKKRLDFIVVDHIGLVKVRGYGANNRTQAVEHISQELTRLAGELDCVVIILSQINRGAENKGDNRPTLAELKHSGAIEEDAYSVILLYRDDYYHPDTTDKPGIGEAIIAKNRDGKMGVTVELHWNEASVTYQDLQGGRIWETNGG